MLRMSRGWLLFLLLTLSLGRSEASVLSLRGNQARYPSVSQQDLNAAVEVAEDYLDKLSRLEENLAASGIEVRENSPSHGQLIDSYPTERSLALGRSAFVANRASSYLLQRHCQRWNIPRKVCVEAMSGWNASGTALGDRCEAQYRALECEESYPYRSYDGSCNHLSHPSWGLSSASYRRLLPADYADGISQPRRSVSRKSLPSPRFISSNFMPDLDKPDKERTLALVQWTQFIGNDLFHTPMSKMFHTNKGIECCKSDGRALLPRYVHPICQSISIPRDDPDYSPHRTVCMNYVRSLTSMRDDCSFGPADQMNQNSHYLDGSMIYGSSESKALSLRTMTGGRLLSVNRGKDEFMPESESPENTRRGNPDWIWYKSGDPRANQHPHHTAMYTLWVREHNRLARQLSKMNPHWEDETLYQEARRIVVAEMQHITYKAWVPLVLGEGFSRAAGVLVDGKGFGRSFADEVDPSVSNSFATAGFRFINSMYQSRLKLLDEGRYPNETLNLRDYFNKPSIIEKPEMLERLVRGFSTQASQKMDLSYVKDITNYLFTVGENEIGQDVASLDIQRGRDHGLPGYNAFRKLCNLTHGDRFDSFLDTVSPANLNKIKSLYEHPDDVDLLVGAIAETPRDDSLLGPVFQCIIGEQLVRTRDGDRFFYDVKGRITSFREGQIRELKKVTLSRVICDNVIGIKQMQSDAFRVPSPKNPLMSCSDPLLPKMNLGEWMSSK